MPTKTTKKSTNTVKTNVAKSSSNKTSSKKLSTKASSKVKSSTKKASSKKVAAKTTNNKKATTKKSVAPKKDTSKKTISNTTVEYYDLPNKYDKTMVRVLFQTPKKLFVYWEVSEDDRNKYLLENGNDFFSTSTPFLLVKNITKNYSFEVEINDYANSWYFDVPDSKCEYVVELIRKDNYTKVPTSIVSSNDLEVPNNHILFNQNGNEVFFKNVKTNTVSSKTVASLHFIKYAGKAKPVTLNAFYNRFYDEKDLYSLNNPSSF